MADERERKVWRGQVVTVIDTKLRDAEIRDGFGRMHTVRKRDLSPLRDDDERKTFRAPRTTE